MIFEDPNGTRVLYDVGRTVAGPDDPRLGKIDIILVSHMHGDHVGNAHSKAPNAGTCHKPDTSVSAVPSTSTVNIAIAKKAKIVTGNEMPPFFAGDVGPPTGYVLKFSNGLVVYLCGDTGITAEQDKVVRGHYKASLVVMNIGDTFTTGPTEASYVINELVKPNAVTASHANEVATMDGKLIPGTRTDRFAESVNVPVHLPLSGRTMEFDGNGKCQSGC